MQTLHQILKVLLHKLAAKMVLPNQIAEFFGHQYLWKEWISFFDFLFGSIHQENIACEATTFGLVCPDMPSCAETSLDLPGVPFSSLGGIPVQTIIQDNGIFHF